MDAQQGMIYAKRNQTSTVVLGAVDLVLAVEVSKRITGILELTDRFEVLMEFYSPQVLSLMCRQLLYYAIVSHRDDL
jgi:hypothetical protein